MFDFLLGNAVVFVFLVQLYEKLHRHDVEYFTVGCLALEIMSDVLVQLVLSRHLKVSLVVVGDLDEVLVEPIKVDQS